MAHCDGGSGLCGSLWAHGHYRRAGGLDSAHDGATQGYDLRNPSGALSYFDIRIVGLSYPWRDVRDVHLMWVRYSESIECRIDARSAIATHGGPVLTHGARYRPTEKSYRRTELDFGTRDRDDVTLTNGEVVSTHGARY